MRSARFTLGLALLLAPSIFWAGSMARPGGMPDGAETSPRVARLIKQLGDSDFAGGFVVRSKPPAALVRE